MNAVMENIKVCLAGTSVPEVAANSLRSLVLGLCLVLSPLAWAQDEMPASDAGEYEQVNVNEADAETIAMVLDGIGAARAQAIVQYREENGDFSSLQELIMVSGVGEQTVERNSARITFD